MPFLVIILAIESCSDTVFGTGITCHSGLPRKIDPSWGEIIYLVLDCTIFWGCCKIGLSAFCIIDFLPANYIGCLGLSCSWETGNLSVFFLIPALPWPILGLTWDIIFSGKNVFGV